MSAKYKLLANGCIERASDGACIPPVEANADYKEFLDWVFEGNAPDPVDPPTGDSP